MKKKNGFIAISLIYSFFLCFIMIMMGLLANYTHSKLILDKINTPLEFKKQTEDNTCPDGNCGEDGGEDEEYNYCKDTCKPLDPPADFQNLLSELIYDSSYYGSLSRLETKDNDGTSYVVFGKNPDNYVKFGQIDGKDLIWRILRINGDGSIRIILDSSIGKVRFYEREVHSPQHGVYRSAAYDNTLFLSPWIPCPEDDDSDTLCGWGAAYFDYNVCKTNQSKSLSESCYIYYNYEYNEEYNEKRRESHYCNAEGNLHPYADNLHDSAILSSLNVWYGQFLDNNEDLECKIVFSSFCSDNYYSNKIEITQTVTNPVYPYNSYENPTYYYFYTPLKKLYSNLNINTPAFKTLPDEVKKGLANQIDAEKPTLNLQCSENGHIYKSKIGIVTAEEVKMVEFSDYRNNKFNWLNADKAEEYWTMSPAWCVQSTHIDYTNYGKNYGYCKALSVDTTNKNQLSFSISSAASSQDDVYPVISLDKNITITGGKGTKDNPYTLE